MAQSIIATDEVFISILKMTHRDLLIKVNANFILSISFCKSGSIKTPKNKNQPACLENAIKQLNEYFKGERKVFNLKLAPLGTEFQNLVWNALKDIPYGETRSYKDIAVAIKNPKAARAIGMANNKNPFPIIVPCHRVIEHNGGLGGFAGGLETKQLLLDLEAK